MQSSSRHVIELVFTMLLLAAMPACAHSHDWQSVVSASMPAVVRILVPDDEAQGTDSRSSAGSGFVIDPSGNILTNSHIVSGGTSFRVEFHDGSTYDARLIDNQPWIDLAVLRIEAGRALPYLTFADPETIAVGAPVLAIGSPLSYPFSVTAGVISGLGRTYTQQDATGFVQHDAATNPGSSGSPLLDRDGRVVGITAAIADEDLFDIGVALAVPAELARRYVETVQWGGAYEHGMLGVRVRELTPQIGAALSIDAAKGLLVEYVRPRSAAASSGISVGDVLIRFDDVLLTSPTLLGRQLWERRPGEQVALRVERDGRRRTLNVTLQPRDDSVLQRFTMCRCAPEGDDRVEESDFGLEFTDVRGPRVHGGARIIRVADESLAEHSGLQAGDRVLMLNGRAVDSAEQARRLVSDQELRVLVALVARDGGEQQFIVMSRGDRQHTLRGGGVSF
jgi:S1-C subfamily serine protease